MANSSGKIGGKIGKVKWYSEEKGYGFIEEADGRDLFVHYKECRGKLSPGDVVEYEPAIGVKGGPVASRVKVVEPSQPELEASERKVEGP